MLRITDAQRVTAPQNSSLTTRASAAATPTTQGASAFASSLAQARSAAAFQDASGQQAGGSMDLGAGIAALEQSHPALGALLSDPHMQALETIVSRALSGEPLRQVLQEVLGDGDHGHHGHHGVGHPGDGTGSDSGGNDAAGSPSSAPAPLLPGRRGEQPVG